jgi:hypothetical protein
MLLYKVVDSGFWESELGKHLSKNAKREQVSLDRMQDILAELGLRYINNYADRYNTSRKYTPATHYFLITYKPLFMLTKIRFGL